MGFFRYILFILFLALFIKLLISYVEKLSISLNDKIIKSQIELGLLSIKDFQKDNYETFIKIIKIYLDILGFKNISLLNSDDNKLTDFKCISNTDSILVSCAQNSLYGKEAKDEDDWETTGRPEIQSFLARMYINDCKKGIFITNSYFSDLAIEFVDNFNNKNQDVEIKLINGYELTKSIRNHKYYILKEELLNETKYNI
ncbi:restriction endonuclease [uncultured Clostridium sp.]|uniref:restriction endonuclease n=1 Tax=uncultured Clostridium sp. TaxID=59620 RepID=UPI0025EAB11A|nr:restriction endonuclease [uncultured Clostridium sp.]